MRLYGEMNQSGLLSPNGKMDAMAFSQQGATACSIISAVVCVCKELRIAALI